MQGKRQAFDRNDSDAGTEDVAVLLASVSL